MFCNKDQLKQENAVGPTKTNKLTKRRKTIKTKQHEPRVESPTPVYGSSGAGQVLILDRDSWRKIPMRWRWLCNLGNVSK